MDAIKAYRKRRRERLLKRLDEEDVKWITMKNGEHVPLKDGEAVGGPMKGDPSIVVISKKGEERTKDKKASKG